MISRFLLLVLSSPNLHLLFEWVHPRFSTKAPDSYNPLSSLHTWLHHTHLHLCPVSPSHPYLSHPVCSSSSFWTLTESRVLDAQHPCTVDHNVPLSLTVFHLFHPYCFWSTSGPFPFVRNIGQGQLWGLGPLFEKYLRFLPSINSISLWTPPVDGSQWLGAEGWVVGGGPLSGRENYRS